MYLNTSDLSPSKTYFALIQTLLPRPVAWVLSENEDSSINLAPFSYFSGISSDPPLLMFVAGKKPSGTIKDTRTNIVAREHFVVNIAHTEQANLVTQSSSSLEYGDSEVEAFGIETAEFDGFPVPRIRDCRVAYACERYKVEAITEDQAMIFGLIKKIYIDDTIISPDERRLIVDAKKLDPLARLGGDDYAGITLPFTVKRPR